MPFPQLTSTANDIVLGAAIEATSLRHYEQEPVHLLLAYMLRDNNRAKGILRAAGMTLENARPVVQSLDIRSYDVGHRVVEVYSHAFTDVLDYAGQLANNADQSLVTPNYLFLALIQIGDPGVGEVLSQLDVKPSGLVFETRRVLDKLKF